MKKRIYKILGVGLVLVVVASLFGFAVPVAADPGNVLWEPYDIPGPAGALGGFVLEPSIQVLGPIAAIGDTIYVGAWDDFNLSFTIQVGEIMIYKSTNGGRTWAPTGYSTDVEVVASHTTLGAFARITDICIVDANTVYVTNGGDIFKSTDGGATWIPLTNLRNYGIVEAWAPAANGYITAIDVAKIGTDTYVFAAASSFFGAFAWFGGGATGGGVFVCWEWALGMPWERLGVDVNRPTPWAAGAGDCYDVRADPNNFATTQAVIAVAENLGTAQTFVTAKHLGFQWNAFVGDARLDTSAPGPTNVTSPYRAQLWLPENFDYSLLPAGGELFVGIAAYAAGQGDVYRMVGAPPNPLGSYTFDQDIAGPVSATNVTGLDGVGVSGAAVLLAAGDATPLGAPGTPTLFRTATNGALWIPNTKGPTGAASPWAPFGIADAEPTVAVADDFASTGRAWVATSGADCGVSLTEDFGATSNTIGLIRTNIDLLQDFSASSDGATIFLATDDWFVGTNVAPTTFVDSIWRFDGFWERVFSQTLSPLTPGNVATDNVANDEPDWVEMSPDDLAVFMMDADGCAFPVAGSYRIYRSLDLGQSWLLQSTAVGYNDLVPDTVSSWSVINSTTVVCGVLGEVDRTSNNGVIWSEFPIATMVATPVMSIAMAPGYTDPGALIAGNSTGLVATSANGGATWVPAAASALPAGNTYVAFDANYATNGVYYATSQAGQIFRWNGIAWARIDNQGQGPPNEFPMASGRGIISTAGCPGTESVLYVAASAGGVGMARCLNPRAPVAAPNPYWERASEGLSTQAFADLAPGFNAPWLWINNGVGTNTLWSIDNQGVDMGLYHYTDTLATCVTLTSPADGDTIMEPMPLTAPWRVTLTWEALPGALDYQVVVDTLPSFLGGLPGGETITYIAGGTSATLSLVRGASENTTFYWRVRVAFSTAVPGIGFGAPVRSYWAATNSFTTSPAPPANIAIYVMPMAGAQNVAVNTTFQWEEIWGATHYQWDLATDSTFGTILESQTPIDPFCQPAATLDYDTTYAWRVRAMADTTPLSDWVRSSFHTEVEPISPVDVSDVTVSPEEITPVWIWVIIVIGALLVIAVIILIMTTRQAR